MSKLKLNKGIIMIVLGIAIIAVPFVMRVMDDKRSQDYIENFEEDKNHEDEEKKDSSNKKKTDALFNQENVIGIIEIPSIDLKYPIFEGDGNDQLNNGIGHLTTTAQLLEKGNCMLAGHNGSRRGIFFTNLNTIKEQADVIITTKDDRTRTYEVVETKIVGPYNAAIREQTPDETLTLFTCAYHGTQRFVCICKVKSNQ